MVLERMDPTLNQCPCARGEQGMGAANLARRLIDAVRRRKGLPVEAKVVESATKQRTRARKV
jgi:ribosome assembly protein 1